MCDMNGEPLGFPFRQRTFEYFQAENPFLMFAFCVYIVELNTENTLKPHIQSCKHPEHTEFTPKTYSFTIARPYKNGNFQFDLIPKNKNKEIFYKVTSHRLFDHSILVVRK